MKKTKKQRVSQYCNHGIQTIPLKPNSKQPNNANWQNTRCLDESIIEQFSDDANIGILLGQASGGLVDIDLDCKESIGLAISYLTPTSMYGHSNQITHYLYRSKNVETKKYTFQGKCILECRSDGAQSMAPGSIHPNGQRIEFVEGLVKLKEISKQELEKSIGKLAAASLLSKIWAKFEGKRQDTIIALAGSMFWNGYGLDETISFVRPFLDYVGDPELEMRTFGVRQTHEKFNLDKPVTGAPRFMELVGDDVGKKVLQWLGISNNTNKETSNNIKNDLNQTDILMRIAMEHELFHDDLGETWAFECIEEGGVCIRIRSQAFKNLLLSEYYIRYGKTVRKDSVSNAIDSICAITNRNGKKHTLKYRFHFLNGQALFIDLCNSKHEVVKINSDGWKVIGQSTPLFKKTNIMAPQILPIHGGDVRRLLDIINLTDPGEQILFLVWVVLSALESIQRPILCLTGPQGSAKTTAANTVLNLMDPKLTSMSVISKKIESLSLQISKTGIFGLDNLDRLNYEQSDFLCQVVTGGSFQKRKLYTDDELQTQNIQKAMIMTGINCPALKPDLLDRMIILSLNRIDGSERKDNEFIDCFFQKNGPEIFGAICSALSYATANIENVDLKERFRMADFTKWGAIVAEAIGYSQEEFISAYRENIQRSESMVLDHPLSIVLLDFMSDQPGLAWKGTKTQLWEGLKRKLPLLDNPKSFPASINALGRRLKELEVPLRTCGLDITEDKGRSKGRLVTIIATQELIDEWKNVSQPSHVA